ncbi:hypothetical protein [Paenibacillus sp. A14]|uniref:hypothetical protein n=1 Tax=Paenibacillus sp. A14 TaxID=3119820 RepID=UPI002FE3C976
MLLAEAADWPQMGSIKEGLMQRHCPEGSYFGGRQEKLRVPGLVRHVVTKAGE